MGCDKKRGGVDPLNIKRHRENMGKMRREYGKHIEQIYGEIIETLRNVVIRMQQIGALT